MSNKTLALVYADTIRQHLESGEYEIVDAHCVTPTTDTTPPGAEWGTNEPSGVVVFNFVLVKAK